MADNAGLSSALDGIPMVADAAARDARYPLATRKQNQRVFRLDTLVQERWSGSSWVVDWAAGGSIASEAAARAAADAATLASATAYTDTIPGAGRTVTTLHSYVAHNAVFNVKDYGAVMDGLTDDSTALRAALAAASANGGGTVLVPAGVLVYNPDGGLAYVKSNVTLRGQGVGLSIIRRSSIAASTDGGVFLGDPTSTQTNIGVCDLTFDGNRASTTPAGAGVVLFAKHLSGFVYSNIEIVNAPFFAHNAQNCSYGVVSNVHVHATNRDGFSWGDACAYISMSSIVSHDTGDDAFAINENTGSAHHIAVAGLTCYRGGLNTDGTGSGGANLKVSGACHHLSFAGVTLDTSGDWGIGIIAGDTGHSPYHIEMTGVKVTGAGQRAAATNKQGIQISGAASNVRIAGSVGSGLADGVTVDSGCTDIHLDVLSESNAGHGFKFDGTGARLGRIAGKLVARNNGACGILAAAMDRLALLQPLCTDNNTAGGVATNTASGINVQDVGTLRIVGGDSSQYNTGAPNKQLYGLSLTGTACAAVTVTGHSATVATAANNIFVQTLPTGTYRFLGCVGLTVQGKDVFRFESGTGSFILHAHGTGSPATAAVVCAPGSTYVQDDGGASSAMFWIKTANTDGTGWLPLVNIDNTGSISPTTGTFKVGGNQVVGVRGGAVADVASANATDLASAITLANETKAQLNALLSRLRSTTGHGLIT